MSRTPVAGSTLVAAQRSVRSRTASRTGPRRDLASNPCCLGPGLHIVDDDVGTEAQGIDRAADLALDGAYGGEIDDVEIGLATIGEVVALGGDDLRRPAQVAGHVGGHELLDDLPAGRRHQVARRDDLPPREIVSVLVSSSMRLSSVASRSFLMSMRKLVFGTWRGDAASNRP